MKTERVQGIPSLPATADVELIGAAGDFEEPGDLSTTAGPGVWVEGTFDTGETVFLPGDSSWQQAELGGCLPVVPDNPASAGALYLGNGCTYGGPLAPQAVRYHLTGVTREDALTFKFLRSVRYGQGYKDQFYVFVTPAEDGDGLLGARTVFYLDQRQLSYVKWRQTDAIRLGDFFSATEWPELTAGQPTTQDLYLYFVFRQKIVGQTGLGLGVIVDDVSVGRKARETLAEYEYDIDECAGGQNGDPCIDGDESTNRPKGNLTKLRSYRNGRVISEQTLIYKGLNGRVSGDEQAIDWAGVGQFQDFVSRYQYSPLGLVREFHAPYMPTIEGTRKYVYSFNKGYLDGIQEQLQGQNHLLFIGDNWDPPSIEYSPSGAPKSLQMANGILHTYARDDLGRLQSIDVARVSESTETLWASGFFDYDGVGNIAGIGAQQFAYDDAGRIKTAQVLPQATNPEDSDPYVVTYGYDTLGSMTSRDWSKPSDPQASAPIGMPVSHEFDRATNHVIDSEYAYDLNGNLIRAFGTNKSVSTTWDALGRMTAFAWGQPDREMVLVQGGDGNVRMVRNPSGISAPDYYWLSDHCQECGLPPWVYGSYGVGYEAGSGAEELIETEVSPGATSVYTRFHFSLDADTTIESLNLGADYDDGYAAWINGEEVFRSPELPTGILHDDTIASPHESSNLPSPDYGGLHDISTVGIPALHTGDNVLAIGVWNESSSSDDLVLVPRLSAQRSNEGHSVVARYAYDANGYRLVDYPDGGNGVQRISIRDGAGNVVSEFIVNPSTGNPLLARDFVYGLGQLLVERGVNNFIVDLLENDPLTEGGDYSFTVSDDSGAGSYTVDIRAASGYVNHLTGVVPTNGKILLDETEFALGETNQIRVRPEGVGEAGYSAPATLMIDPNVTPSSVNQTRAIGVFRSGTDLVVRFAFLEPNGKSTDGYFQRADTGQHVLQTPVSLTPVLTTFTIDEQSLAVPCGELMTEQDDTYSAGVLPPKLIRFEMVPGDDCDPLPNPGDLGIDFVDSYHHRDHLGSLRLVTDETGYEVGAHDFYPFGMEMDPDMLAADDSRMRYTGHKRDELTDTYYMKARYKTEGAGFFMSPDSIFVVPLDTPGRWNAYGYVYSNPIRFVDPSGHDPDDLPIYVEKPVKVLPTKGQKPPSPTVYYVAPWWLPPGGWGIPYVEPPKLINADKLRQRFGPALWAAGNFAVSGFNNTRALTQDLLQIQKATRVMIPGWLSRITLVGGVVGVMQNLNPYSPTDAGNMANTAIGTGLSVWYVGSLGAEALLAPATLALGPIAGAGAVGTGLGVFISKAPIGGSNKSVGEFWGESLLDGVNWVREGAGAAPLPVP